MRYKAVKRRDHLFYSEWQSGILKLHDIANAKRARCDEGLIFKKAI